jgi:predicted membrane protein
MDRHTPLSRFLLAFSFIYSGLVILGYKTQFITPEVFHMIFNWQMLLIAIGFVSLAKTGNNVGGYILLIVGTFFIIPEFVDIPWETRQLFLPALLIGIGLIVLFKGFRGTKYNSKAKKFNGNNIDINDTDMINDSHIFSGGEFHITSDNFKGGKISAIMGGGKYNLRNAKLAEGVQVIDVSLIFGGVELQIPAEWDVKVEVTSIFGGFSNKNIGITPETSTSGKLIIKGSAIFGGGELKRF